MTGKQYSESPIHAAVDTMVKAVGIPTSCITNVICCDCGNETIAAHCSWHINVETFECSGPHCGCRKR